MNHLLFIGISVVVAAFIGGLTNYLAIKMLFHPRKAVYLGAYRLPFTPGLIPKRREQIARSLGAVVGNYLVTSNGLTETLQKPEFRSGLENKLSALVHNGAEREETLKEWLAGWWPPDQIERVERQLADWLRRLAEEGALWLWEDRGWSAKTLSEAIPGWNRERRDEAAERLARHLAEGIAAELASPEGSALLRRAIGKFLEQGGGFLGTLAGLFMDQDRMTAKVKLALMDGLRSPAAHAALAGLLRNQMERLERMSLSELMAAYVDPDPKGWIAAHAASILRPDAWVDSAASLTLRPLLSRHKGWLLDKVPAVSGFLIRLLEDNMEKIVQAIHLPDLVDQQVRRFPIERLEQVILSVSGEEFRAITWLGALLGGFIGLLQSLFMLLWMNG